MRSMPQHVVGDVVVRKERHSEHRRVLGKADVGELVKEGRGICDGNHIHGEACNGSTHED